MNLKKLVLKKEEVNKKDLQLVEYISKYEKEKSNGKNLFSMYFSQSRIR